MSPLRFLRELVVLGCATGGAVIGYSAGVGAEPTVQVCLSFLGMSVGGGLAEFCMTRP